MLLSCVYGQRLYTIKKPAGRPQRAAAARAAASSKKAIEDEEEAEAKDKKTLIRRRKTVRPGLLKGVLRMFIMNCVIKIMIWLDAYDMVCIIEEEEEEEEEEDKEEEEEEMPVAAKKAVKQPAKGRGKGKKAAAVADDEGSE